MVRVSSRIRGYRKVVKGKVICVSGKRSGSRYGMVE